MPDINPFIDVVARKFYLAQACYTLHDVVLGKKFVTNIDDYITDQLDYDYYQIQNNDGDGLSMRDISISIQLIARHGRFRERCASSRSFKQVVDPG